MKKIFLNPAGFFFTFLTQNFTTRSINNTYWLASLFFWISHRIDTLSYFSTEKWTQSCFSPRCLALIDFTLCKRASFLSFQAHESCQTPPLWATIEFLSVLICWLGFATSRESKSALTVFHPHGAGSLLIGAVRSDSEGWVGWNRFLLITDITIDEQLDILYGIDEELHYR